MKGYFTGIILVVLLSSAVLSITPSDGSKKYIRLVCGLCTVGCMLIPAAQAFGSLWMSEEDIISKFEYSETAERDYAEIYNKNLNSTEIKNAEASLKRLIIEELSLNYADFDIAINAEIKSDEFYISSVTLKIYPSGVNIEPSRVTEYISEKLDCPAEVYYTKK